MARLTGMKEIVDHTKNSEATIRKWMKTENFPAANVGGTLESDTILIDKWRIWRVLKKNNATDKTFAEVIKSLGMAVYS